MVGPSFQVSQAIKRLQKFHVSIVQIWEESQHTFRKQMIETCCCVDQNRWTLFHAILGWMFLSHLLVLCDSLAKWMILVKRLRHCEIQYKTIVGNIASLKWFSSCQVAMAIHQDYHSKNKYTVTVTVTVTVSPKWPASGDFTAILDTHDHAKVVTTFSIADDGHTGSDLLHLKGHGHGHGLFILATCYEGKWTTNPK